MTIKKLLISRWQSPAGSALAQAIKDGLMNQLSERELAEFFVEKSLENKDSSLIDCRGLPLNGLFSNLSLSLIDFSYAYSLKGREQEDPFILFQKCRFEGCRFDAIKTEIAFENCQLVDCDLSSSNLAKSFFLGQVVEGCSFDKTNLKWANFNTSNISHCSFLRANISFGSFERATISYSDFSETNLTEASFKEAHIDSNTSFEGANLANSNLNEVLPLTIQPKQYQELLTMKLLQNALEKAKSHDTKARMLTSIIQHGLSMLEHGEDINIVLNVMETEAQNCFVEFQQLIEITSAEL